MQFIIQDTFHSPLSRTPNERLKPLSVAFLRKRFVLFPCPERAAAAALSDGVRIMDGEFSVLDVVAKIPSNQRFQVDVGIADLPVTYGYNRLMMVNDDNPTIPKCDMVYKQLKREIKANTYR